MFSPLRVNYSNRECNHCLAFPLVGHAEEREARGKPIWGRIAGICFGRKLERQHRRRGRDSWSDERFAGALKSSSLYGTESSDPLFTSPSIVMELSETRVFSSIVLESRLYFQPYRRLASGLACSGPRGRRQPPIAEFKKLMKS